MNKKEYAVECGKLSKKYGIGFEVCLVLGTSESTYKGFLQQLYRLEMANAPVRDNITSLLRSDSKEDNKIGVMLALGSYLFDELRLDEKPKNLDRICLYLCQTSPWRIYDHNFQMTPWHKMYGTASGY